MDTEDRQLQTIVNTGLMFISALTERYGVDKGNDVWQSICEAVDDEAKGAIMFAMLTGKRGNVVTLRGVAAGQSTNVNKVQAIKAVRNATGLGLKEAKDLVDTVHPASTFGGYSSGYQSSYRGSVPPQIEVRDHHARAELLRELLAAGYSAD